MKHELLILRGLSGSGKTTLAQGKYGQKYIRVNKDDLRPMLHGPDTAWSSERERATKAAQAAIIRALAPTHNIVVDNTHLLRYDEEELRGLATELHMDFREEWVKTSLATCISADAARSKPIGSAVIQRQHKTLSREYPEIAKELVPQPPADIAGPTCVIVDIDGTIAHNTSKRGWFEWDKVHLDSPRKNVIQVVKAYVEAEGITQILFVSGRDETCYILTALWLDKYFEHDDWNLFMRPEGNNEDDTVIKRRIYEENIKGKYNVRAIFDDRPKVIRMWQELGFSDRIFNVGTGEEF